MIGCMNGECTKHRITHDDYICKTCGHNRVETERRKKLIRENGLTTNRWGARYLIITNPTIYDNTERKEEN